MPRVKHKDDLSLPLNARQIARTLLYRPHQEVIFEEFLLWPPDLFAFTSYVFSITGAYNLVVSPHHSGASPKDASSKAKWPPDNDKNARWADYKDGWTEYVQSVGFTWRTLLAGYTDRDAGGKVMAGDFDEELLRRCKDKELPGEERGELIRATVGRLVGEGASARWEESGSWVPREVGECWAGVYGRMNEEDDVEDLLDDWEAFKLMMTLHAIVDEACVGWGIRDIPFQFKDGKYGPHEDALKGIRPDGLPDDSGPARFAASRLKDFGTLSTIDRLRGRVLPKRHTPSIGITLRSLTNNLAYHRSSVDVKWVVTDKGRSNAFTDRLADHKSRNRTFSILLLPWPRKINTLDFKAVEEPDKKLGLHDRLGLFHYKPEDDWLDPKELRQTLASAKREVGNIDMVILPECALRHKDIETLEAEIGSGTYGVSAYVAGVRGGADDEIFTDNMVFFKMGYADRKGQMRYESPGGDDPDEQQHKHHRWKIDRFQVENYSLGYVLSPNVKWWESIRIRPRKVTFINVGNELTICPLICEDLARQDPIADLIRTVGPSLVITILMDGPQTKERWSARYASVLSEDPGSAVITLTSAGMVDRWRRPKFNTPRYVALWNDGQGSEREIELEEDSAGVLLSLSVFGVPERSADGRMESYPTNRVILGGVHQVRIPRK